jgi:hypothetical protein
MTDHDDSYTEIAPTEQASPPIAELPSAKHAEIPEAGSLDDATEADSAPPRNRYVRAGTLTLLAVIAAMILIPLLAALFR